MGEPETTSRPARARWIEYLPIDDIPGALVNPKTHDRAGIVSAIETFDFTEPGVIDERTGRLIAGHGRRDALRWMRDANKPTPEGIATDGPTWLAPVVRGWFSKDDDHAHAAGIAINRHTETGGWDEEELVTVLDRLGSRDTSMPLMAGFDDTSVNDLRRVTGQLGSAATNFLGSFLAETTEKPTAPTDPAPEFTPASTNAAENTSETQDLSSGEVGADQPADQRSELEVRDHNGPISSQMYGEQGHTPDGVPLPKGSDGWYPVTWTLTAEGRDTVRRAVRTAQTFFEVDTQADGLIKLCDNFLTSYDEGEAA